VAGVSVAPLGEPWTSAVASVDVVFDDGATACLVAKVRRGGRARDGMIHRELYFYQHVASRLGACVPRCWFAQADLDGEFLLLLERAPGEHPADGLALEDAVRVLRALGEVHGRCWSEVALREALPARVYPAGEVSRLVAAVREGWSSVWTRFPRHLPALPDLGDLPDAAASLQPATLTHNDLHAQNVLVGPAGVVFVDWQNASWSTPLVDVANVLAGCVRPEVQRDHGPALLAAWQDALVEAGGARLPDLGAGYRAAAALLFAWVTRYLASVSDEEAASRSLLLRHWERVCAGVQGLPTPSPSATRLR
jgi:Ser/Thr protein kinase RdoA (MazF antagonist)